VTSGIEIRRASKRFQSQLVLDAVDLEVPPATTTVLVGPSGCGKSTLLRLVNGLVQPDSGEILCGGERLTSETVTTLRRRMGYVIQEGGLFPHLSARKNVTLMAEVLGWSPARMDERVKTLAQLVRLPNELLARPPSGLSGGQRQRVSLMRALMLEPEVVLLDEPLGALDPIVRVELQDELREVFKTVGATVLLVTHDLAEAVHFADRIVVLNAGKVAWSGSPDELLAEQSDPFVVRLLGSHRELRPRGATS
jgi:osmoprotectant transport system ATP-binding protein